MKREARSALFLAVPLLLLSVLTGLWVDSARSEAGLIPSPGRIPLGGFEPVVVDLIWIRAENYLAQGRYHEAVASIRIATELQPRVPENWVMLGHLLAWRTSESSGDPEVHWRWAKQGIEVIERGLLHNPENPVLLVELGTLYLQRVSARPDVAKVAERDLGEPPALRAISAFERLGGVLGDTDLLGNSAEARRLLGERLAERGQVEAAIVQLRRAAEMFRAVAEADPEFSGALENAARIERTIDELQGR